MTEIINPEDISTVTFELREHSDGKWDTCILAPDRHTQKFSRLTFNNAIEMLLKLIEIRDKARISK